MIKRVFLIVLDSFGVGELPDAASYGDAGSNTISACAATGLLNVPNMAKLGLFNIAGVKCGEKLNNLTGSYCRMAERSAGKDTTTGHWELMGLTSHKAMPTYPNGFPKEILEEFSKRTGRGVICNRTYSGTDVIRDYGDEQLKTGNWIIYTSADSVFQIAAHEDKIPLEELYEACRTARSILQGAHAVGRVIARPFDGKYPFSRTANRRDFSLIPPKDTLLDKMMAKNLATIGVGKISDIFAAKGISEHVASHSNDEGMKATLDIVKNKDFTGLCFVNLVDFDMKYGHRNDAVGYASALTRFDQQLGEMLPHLRDDDVLILTADHGCDPSTPSTDHSREYVPVLIYGNKIKNNANLGTRNSFGDLAATVGEMFGIKDFSDEYNILDLEFNNLKINNLNNNNLKLEDSKAKELVAKAIAARELSYSPYSNFMVGAALLCENGKIYTGCNIESAAYSSTNCAERTAFFKAVSEGEKKFTAIAIAGGAKGAQPLGLAYPCGVCRQVMMEFCEPKKFEVLVAKSENDYNTHTLEEFLPMGFGPEDLKK